MASTMAAAGRNLFANVVAKIDSIAEETFEFSDGSDVIVYYVSSTTKTNKIMKIYQTQKSRK